MAHHATAQPDGVALAQPSSNGSAPPPTPRRRHPPRRLLIPLVLGLLVVVGVLFWLASVR
jgi:hypothetical protein